MAEAEAKPPDPEGCWCVPPEKSNSGAPPEEQVGAEGHPQEPGRSGEPPLEEVWEVLPEAPPPAPGDSPPAKESGSRTHSDVEGMFGDNILLYLHCKFKAVSLFPDPAAREFLIARLRDAEAFLRLLKLQARDSQKVAQLEAENQRLQQELQEAKRSHGTGSRFITLPWSKTDFRIQMLPTGKTGGCEKHFFKKVSDLLSKQDINLKAKKYQEGSGHFLLVFCPVASRVGSDMQNAVEKLPGESKAVLVMMHHKPKENTTYVDTKLQAQHPAVVRTVHARYTLQEGFYSCPENEEAVAIVADVLEDRCYGGKGDPANP